MSVARFVQNFSRRRALLASADARAIAALTATLHKLGLVVETLGLEPGEDAPRAFDPARDILFLDGDLDAPPVLVLEAACELPPVPVVGLVGVEAPSRLKALMQAGATAFLPKPVYGGSVYSALYLAVNEHARKAALGAAVGELEMRRRQRRHVIKAVVLAMQARGVDDEAAFQILRREAMRARLGLETYCEKLVRSPTGPDAEDAAALGSKAATD